MDENAKSHLAGMNHVALEVGNIEEALAFYDRIFHSRCAAAVGAPHSSTWATGSSR